MNRYRKGTSLGKAGTFYDPVQGSLETSGSGSSLLWAPLVAIAATAFAVEIPFLFLGTPSGHDVEFHLYSWLEVLSQWKHGILYPRWASMAHFAYGEPRFVFYPPASWMLGAALSAIFPWTIASGIYIWMALTISGLSMFILARRWLDGQSAIFAAVLYTASPYHLVIVYWRSAFGELLASCLVPLLLLCVLRLVNERTRAIVPLGLVLAASWLTNAPAAIMIHYSMALLLVFFACRRRCPRLLLMGAAAVALGACLSGFYLLPAVYEQRWIEVAQAVSAGSRPADNFLFIHTSDADHDAFNHIVTSVAVFEMTLIFAGVWLTRQWRKRNLDLPNALLGWAVACSVLMFPVSALLWRILPKLRFMQFPWRWLLCLSLIFSLSVTLAMRRWSWRVAVLAISILVIALSWHRIQPPWWDNAGDLREMQDNIEARTGYEGTDEYTPAGAEPGSIDKAARNIIVAGAAHAAIRVSRWDAEWKIFSADMSAPDQLALRLFRYPAWQAQVNGRVVETAASETGQILISVTAGLNRVQIHFIRTWDRTVGAWISLITLLLTVLRTCVRAETSTEIRK